MTNTQPEIDFTIAIPLRHDDGDTSAIVLLTMAGRMHRNPRV